MRLLFVVLAFCFASQSWASVNPKPESVTLDMKLEMNGKQVASPRMTMNFGKKGMISEQAPGDSSSYSIEVEPTKRTENLVALNVVVSRMENGMSKILSTTKITAENGRPAEITRKQSELQDLRLVITPTF